MSDYETKYIFTQIDSDGNKVSVEFTAIHIDEIINKFGDFLSGCSFHPKLINKKLYGDE